MCYKGTCFFDYPCIFFGKIFMLSTPSPVSLSPLARIFALFSPKYLMYHISIAFILAIVLPWQFKQSFQPFLEVMQVPKELFSLVVKVLAPVIAFSALFTGILRSLQTGSKKSFFGSLGFYLAMCSVAVLIAFPIGYIASEHLDNQAIKQLIQGNLESGKNSGLEKAAVIVEQLADTQTAEAHASQEVSKFLTTLEGSKAAEFAQQMSNITPAQEKIAQLYTKLAEALTPKPETTFEKLTHSTILWAVFLGILFAFVTDAKMREFEHVATTSPDPKKQEAAAKLAKASSVFINFFEWLKPVAIQTLFLLVAVLSPWAIIGSLGGVIAKYGLQVLSAYKDIILIVFAALLCQAVFLFFVTRVLARVNPFRILAMCKRTLLLALSTSSSKACLPYAMEDVEKMGVGRRFVDYQIALGSSINMDGTAIYMGIMAFVFSYAWTGHHLDFATMAQLVFSCTVFAIGAAGIPSGSLIFLSTIFPAVGVPASAIFAIQPIDAFLDRGRTVLNIWGDITGAVTRAAIENELDRTVLNGVEGVAVVVKNSSNSLATLQGTVR
jgi:Na+/H+-dicarboxylate symporter